MVKISLTLESLATIYKRMRIPLKYLLEVKVVCAHFISAIHNHNIDSDKIQEYKSYQTYCRLPAMVYDFSV